MKSTRQWKKEAEKGAEIQKKTTEMMKGSSIHQMKGEKVGVSQWNLTLF